MKKKFSLLTMILSLFFVCYSVDPTLYAGNKKEKNQKKSQKAKAAKLKKQHKELQEDYQYTMEHFVLLLQRLVTVYDELGDRMYEIENKSLIHDKELFLIKEIFEKKALEDDTFRLGFDVPFFEEPVYINKVYVERHKKEETP